MHEESRSFELAVERLASEQQHTRAEVSQLRVEFRGELRESRDDLRGELREWRDDLRGELRESRDGTRGEFLELRDGLRGELLEVREDLRRLDNRIFQTLLGVLATLATSIGALIAAVVA